jgi:hypothetical protein
MVQCSIDVSKECDFYGISAVVAAAVVAIAEIEAAVPAVVVLTLLQ